MPEGGAPPVLVVEDDELTRSFLRHALRTAGLTTVDAIRGEQALEHVRGGGELAGVLIDGLLPDMHGWALATRLLEEPAGALLPILFVTGALRRPMITRAGVAAMVKPIRVADLAGQMSSLRAWRERGGSPLKERRLALADLEAGFLVGP